MATDVVVLEESRAMSEVSAARQPFSCSRWANCRPWLGWAFVYVVVLLFCFIDRIVALADLVAMYGNEEDDTFGVKIAVLSLGLLEDFVCATYLAFALWLVDTVQGIYSRTVVDVDAAATMKVKKVGSLMVVFLLSWILFLLALGPFAADLLLVRLRGVRFTFDLMTSNEKSGALDVMMSNEMQQIYVVVVITSIVGIAFAAVRTLAAWAKLTQWNPVHCITTVVTSQSQKSRKLRAMSTKASSDSDNDVDEVEIVLELVNSSRSSAANTPDNLSICDFVAEDAVTPPSCQGKRPRLYQRGIKVSVILLILIVLPVITVAVSSACPSLIAYAALNATLNELFAHVLGDTALSYVSGHSGGDTPWVETFIHSATENYTLFADDSLCRRTTGFHGDLAFDVNVSGDDPPNVLIIVVESFRFHDSHYLVGGDDPSILFNGTNLTITPNFDKWAKRGVAFTNYWSSWRTSRSVESLQYAQLPYDDVEDSGMTEGKQDVELAGLPQLFKAKGYESFFTTGCQTEYDDWNSFLPAHGFDTVWSRDEMMKIAESDLNVSSDDWYGDEQRGLYWGVHDDLSFQILGDLLINKTTEQRARVAQGESKKPLFLTHYTISSHIPFQERPKWYAESEKPDFSSLYDGKEYADLIHNYLEMRYFTDVELGKFMDRMESEGILNDSIVVITGDHGQAPEFGYDKPEARELSATRVAGALIAEGRLGKFAGLRLEDAAEQYDILNTLADIAGVPEEGFVQDGVGRSLKRNVTFGERVVFSNNPSQKMSVVKGGQRLRYDRYSGDVLLHNSRSDHDMRDDLFPRLSTEEQDEWLAWRDSGRWLNTYYTSRWDRKCLLASEC